MKKHETKNKNLNELLVRSGGYAQNGWDRKPLKGIEKNLILYLK